MMDTTVRIPNAWEPREYQWPLWGYLAQGGKRAVAVWHRRSGKDSVGLNFTAWAALQRVGVYWHLLPELKHARRVVWEGIDGQGRRIINQAFPSEVRESKNEQDMAIRLRNGSTWQLVGSDDADRLVGANPVGVIFSEYALSSPTAWDLVRPILAENGGWALFISTPRGENHFADLYRMAKDNEDWFAELLTAKDTSAIDERQIQAERAAGMPESLVKQEFYCSFTGAVAGAYYAEYLAEAEEEGRIANVPIEKTVGVTTAWDLGLDDATAIWFVQQVGLEVRVIDYYENSGVGLEHYAKILQDKGYTYLDHYLPHDAKVRELGTGRSRVDMLASLGISATVLESTNVEDGIALARSLIPRCYFDETRCARGLKALRSYRTEYNDKLGTYSARPVHDWSSHGADAFRYLAAGLENTAAVKRRRRRGPLKVYGLESYDPLQWGR